MRFTQEQIIGVLKERQADASVSNLCRKQEISDTTFYTWRSKYGGMEMSEAGKLKELEEENVRLKRLLAEFRLFTTKVVVAHGGTVGVTSSELIHKEVEPLESDVVCFSA